MTSSPDQSPRSAAHRDNLAEPTRKVATPVLDHDGDTLVIAVIDAHTSHWLSPSEVIQAAALVPEGSTDPVDLALAASLRRRRDDLFHLDGRAMMKTVPDSFDPATPQRRYSIAKVRGLKIADQVVDVAIMRGELDSVAKAATMSREEGILLRRNANMHHGRGHRNLGVALAPIDAEGNIVGDFVFEGFVAMGLRKLSDAIESNKNGSGSWVEVHLWGTALRIQHWLNFALMLVMTLSGWFIMQPYLTERSYDGSAAGFTMGWVRYVHFVAGFAWIAVGLWRFILLFITRDRQTRWRALWPIYNKQDVTDLWHTVQYYLFLRRSGPFYFAHNPLQQISYTGIYLMCFIQMITGLSLYAIIDQSNWFYVLMAMPTHWIGIGYVRLIHTIIMYLIWVFAIIHVYLVFRSDSVHNHGGLSSMIGGSVWLPRGTQPVDSPRIG